MEGGLLLKILDNAYQTSLLLQNDSIIGTPILSNNGEQEESLLRCFWACWLTQCINPRKSSFTDDCWSGVVRCPLPADDGNLYPEIPRCSLDSSGQFEDLSFPENQLNTYYYSFLIRVFGLWWVALSLIQVEFM